MLSICRVLKGTWNTKCIRVEWNRRCKKHVRAEEVNERSPSQEGEGTDDRSRRAGRNSKDSDVRCVSACQNQCCLWWVCLGKTQARCHLLFIVFIIIRRSSASCTAIGSASCCSSIAVLSCGYCSLSRCHVCCMDWIWM